MRLKCDKNFIFIFSFLFYRIFNFISKERRIIKISTVNWIYSCVCLPLFIIIHVFSMKQYRTKQCHFIVFLDLPELTYCAFHWIASCGIRIDTICSLFIFYLLHDAWFSFMNGKRPVKEIWLNGRKNMSNVYWLLVISDGLSGFFFFLHWILNIWKPWCLNR